MAGSFDDPAVTNSLVDEIITYPVELLYRTFKLPFRAAQDNRNKLDQATRESSSTEKESEVETTKD